MAEGKGCGVFEDHRVMAVSGKSFQGVWNVDKNTILIVDDEEDVVSALKFRLAMSGCEVLTASNGASPHPIPANSAIGKTPRLLIAPPAEPGKRSA